MEGRHSGKVKKKVFIVSGCYFERFSPVFMIRALCKKRASGFYFSKKNPFYGGIRPVSRKKGTVCFGNRDVFRKRMRCLDQKVGMFCRKAPVLFAKKTGAFFRKERKRRKRGYFPCFGRINSRVSGNVCNL